MPSRRATAWRATGRRSWSTGQHARSMPRRSLESASRDQSGPAVDLKSESGSGASWAREASLESARMLQRAGRAARTSHDEEITVRCKQWPEGPCCRLEEQVLLWSVRIPRCQLGEHQLGERQDVAAGRQGRAHVACRGDHSTRRAVARRARLLTWRAFPGPGHPCPRRRLRQQLPGELQIGER
jgi:hypothetical protein